MGRLKSAHLVIILLGLCLCLCLLFSQANLFTECLIRKGMPDFCQEEPHIKEGKSSCGPTAVSNVLFYLDKNGFPDIISNKDSVNSRLKLINTLRTGKYMKTSPLSGTEPVNLMKGLEKYVRKKDYDIQIRWKGWTDGGSYTIGRIPEPGWIFNALKNSSNSILQIGWYKYNPKNNFYKRIGGHYVTVAGFKKGKIIIHDPSIRSSVSPKDEYCNLIPISSGTLSKWEEYKERNANGYWGINDLRIKEGADTAIIDGAVIFNVFNPKKMNNNFNKKHFNSLFHN